MLLANILTNFVEQSISIILQTMRNYKILTCAFALMVSLTSTAQSNVMTVDTKKAGAPIQNTMYGLFFEDINYAADGGLYGELVKNRSFEFPQAFMG